MDIELEGGAKHTDTMEVRTTSVRAGFGRANLVHSGLNQMIVL